MIWYLVILDRLLIEFTLFINREEDPKHYAPYPNELLDNISDFDANVGDAELASVPLQEHLFKNRNEYYRKHGELIREKQQR